MFPFFSGSIDDAVRDRERLEDAIRRGVAYSPRNFASSDAINESGRTAIHTLSIASALRQTESFPVGAALEIHDAIIMGPLDLSALSIPIPIIFQNCDFSHGLSLRDSSIQSLDIRDADTYSLDLSGLSASRGVSLARVVSTESLTLIDARVDGSLVLHASEFKSGILFTSAKFGGNVHMNDVRVSAGAGIALGLEFARIDGSLGLKSCQVHGPTSCVGLTSGIIMLANCDFQGSTASAFLMHNVVTGEFRVNETDFEGGLALRNSEIRGPVSFEAVTFSGGQGSALDCSLSDINGELAISSCRLEGALRGVAIDIQGQLAIKETEITAQKSDFAGFHGSASDFSSSNIAHGVRIQSSNFDGDIRFDGSKISTLFHLVDVTMIGVITLTGSSVTGQLAVLECRFKVHATPTVAERDSKMVLDHASITQNATLRNCEFACGVRGWDLVVGGTLQIYGDAKSIKTLRDLDLRRAQIGYLPLIDPNFQSDFNLSGSRISTLEITFAPRSKYSLVGIQFDSIEGEIRNKTEPLLGVISSVGEDRVLAQPWLEIAEYNSRVENSNIARRLRTERIRHKVANNGGPCKPLRVHSTLLFRYGYLWWTPGALLAFIFVACFSLLTFIGPQNFIAASSDAIAAQEANAPGSSTCELERPPRASDSTCIASEYPHFSPLEQALNATSPVPLASTPKWIPANDITLLSLAFLKIISWALTTLFVTGLVGLMRRRD